MGIGIATGESRAAEAAKKAISSPLLETSIDGAHGVLMNISGGANLSLYEVQEAADIVTSAADQEVNVIFGSVINENLKDEIVVTVIATGFDESQLAQGQQKKRPQANPASQPKQVEQQPERQSVREEQPRRHTPQPQQKPNQEEDTLDIPTFLRNRNRRR